MNAETQIKKTRIFLAETRSRSNQLSMRRNDIVHGCVMKSGGSYEGASVGYLLMPSLKSAGVGPKTPGILAYLASNNGYCQFVRRLKMGHSEVLRSSFSKEQPWSRAKMPEEVISKMKPK